MNLVQLKDIKGKEKAIAISQTIINAVQNGEVEPIDAIIFLKTISKAIESAETTLKKDLVDAVEKYGKEGYVGQGVEITTMEGGVSYSYSNCGDSVWEQLDQQISALSAEKKNREAFLKSLPLSGQDVLGLDGEVHKCYPPVKKSTSTYKVTFK